MSNEQRISRTSSNSKEDTDLIYDNISGGDAPVDRHDIVLPGQGGRASDDSGIDPAGGSQGDDSGSRPGQGNADTLVESGPQFDGASTPADSSGGSPDDEDAQGRSSSPQNDDNAEGANSAAPLSGEAPRSPLSVEPAGTSGASITSDGPASVPAGTDGGTAGEVDTPDPEKVNLAPTDISATGLGVDENASGGTVVAMLSATDPDGGDTFTYSLDDDPSGYFQVVGDQIVVAPGASIDFETATSHDVTIRVTDSAGNTHTDIFTINVNDVDEFDVSTPIDNDGAANSVAEDAIVGDVVGITALASDADATNNGVTYSLSDDAGGLFAIDANTGVVMVAGALDYETSTSHSIEVTATSADGSTSTENFNIGVTDVNEGGVGAISDTDASGNAVNENVSVGTVVGVTAFATC